VWVASVFISGVSSGEEDFHFKARRES